MKVAIITDIHSNFTALSLIIQYLETQGIQEYVFLGDAISDGYQDNEVVSCVKHYATHAIAGNRDKLVHKVTKRDSRINMQPLYWTKDHLTPTSIEFLKGLPDYKVVNYGDIKVLYIHGDVPLLKEPYEATFDALIELTQFDVCFIGHIHLSFDIFYKGKRFVNPGSAGIPVNTPAYNFVIADFNKSVSVRHQSIDASPSFQSLLTRYQASQYFKDNTVWATLVLDAIQTATYTHEVFFKYIEVLIENDASLEFNEAWYLAFRKYIDTHPTTYHQRLINGKAIEFY